MIKKYELTDQTISVFGRTLFRIKAKISFSDVTAGDIGGYIEKEENLEAYGDAWVYGDARVFGDARVSDYALVSGTARVCDKARVSGDAWVSDYALVSGNARVFGD